MAKKREVWDAVDENGELLGFDLYRDEWGKSPYRRCAPPCGGDFFTVTKQGEVFVHAARPEKRDFRAEMGGDRRLRCKGEKPLAGAVRELRGRPAS